MRISEVSPVKNVESINTTSSHSYSVEEVASTPVQSVESTMTSSAVDENKKDLEANVDMIDKAVKQANKSLQNYDRYLQRTVHEKTKAIMYVMKDSNTDEVVREFPPKKIQDMIAKMWEIAGLFVDEKA